MKTAKPMLSIVVASYYRDKQLKRLLASLSSQLKRQPVEVVIIRNVRGLAAARNKGWQKSRGAYVAFIDDDACAGERWVESIFSFIKRHPKVVAFGGPYSSSNKSIIPNWIPSYLTKLSWSGKGARKLSIGREWLTGTNMIFKRNVLKKMQGFDQSLGLKGKKRSYGEETELQIRLANAGYEVWYDPHIKVEHEFATWKQNIFYLLKDQYTLGKNSQEIFRDLHQKKQRVNMNAVLAKALQPELHWQTRIFYTLGPLLYMLGRVGGKKK